MPATHVALLRAVNLAGHNTVAMRALVEVATAIGFRESRTLLQSGNLVFDTRTTSSRKLESLLEAAVSERLGLTTAFFVRTAREWQGIIAANPFPTEARDDPGHLVLMCLKHAPTPASVTALQRAIPGRERVRATGREAYLVYPDGIGRSRLTTGLIERTLGTSGTARNWNTVIKLGGLLGLS